MIGVAVMGYGTIGSGVAEVLETNKSLIAKRTGQEIRLQSVLDLREFPGTSIENKIVHDFSLIEKNKEIDIVVETMGGLNPAYPWVKACLESGKHVVTSNKALVAAYGTELLQIARKNRVNFFFEASVGGGIPIIRPLYRCLMGEVIQEITGILNGTTNFILTKMDKEGASFDHMLKEAQALGYAERNPEADVEGQDACRKIAILTALVTGREVNYEDIYTEGITRITDIDFQYANKMGTSVKLFASSRMKDGKVHAFVAPIMIGREHPLYAVNGVYNGIMVKGNMVGTTMFYGSGAGKLPTASAVVADIIEAAANLHHHVEIGWSDEKQIIEPMDSEEFCYFVRIDGSYAERKDMIDQTIGQTQVITLDGMDEFAVMTDRMTESDFKKKAIDLEVLLQTVRTDGIRQMIRAELE